MLIEQIIKFELWGPEPHKFLKLVIFMTKQKSPKQILE